MRKPLVNIPAVLGVIGIVMIIVSSWFILRTLNHDKRSITTSGKIIGFVEEKRIFPAGRHFSQYERTIGFMPVIQFTTLTGDVMEFTSSVSYKTIDERPKGSKIELLYDPSNPRYVHVTEGVYTSPFILLITGIILFSFYLYIRIKNSRSINRSANLES